MAGSDDQFQSRVRLYGKNVVSGPIFVSSDVRTIVMDDNSGKPSVILARMDDNAWVMGTRSDSDWEAVKERFGIQE